MSEKADELARRARAIREKRALDSDPGLREDMAELKATVEALTGSLAAVHAAAMGEDASPKRPDLRLIKGEKTG